MLQIQIAGQFADLLQNTALAYNVHQDALDFAAEEGQYTYSFTLPFTAHNAQLLGVPEHSFATVQRDIACSIYADGIPVADGLLNMESMDSSSIELSFEGYMTAFYARRLRDLWSGAKEFIPAFDHLQHGWTPPNRIRYASAIAGWYYPLLMYDDTHCMNIRRVASQGMNGEWATREYELDICPGVLVSALLQQIASSAGYALQLSAGVTEHMGNLLICDPGTRVTYKSSNEKKGSITTGTKRVDAFVKFSDHLPDWSYAEALRAIRQMFCLSVEVDAVAGIIRIGRVTDTLNADAGDIAPLVRGPFSWEFGRMGFRLQLGQKELPAIPDAGLIVDCATSLPSSGRSGVYFSLAQGAYYQAAQWAGVATGYWYWQHVQDAPTQLQVGSNTEEQVRCDAAIPQVVGWYETEVACGGVQDDGGYPRLLIPKGDAAGDDLSKLLGIYPFGSPAGTGNVELVMVACNDSQAADWIGIGDHDDNNYYIRLDMPTSELVVPPQRVRLFYRIDQQLGRTDGVCMGILHKDSVLPYDDTRNMYLPYAQGQTWKAASNALSINRQLRCQLEVPALIASTALRGRVWMQDAYYMAQKIEADLRADGTSDVQVTLRKV